MVSTQTLPKELSIHMINSSALALIPTLQELKYTVSAKLIKGILYDIYSTFHQLESMLVFPLFDLRGREGLDIPVVWLLHLYNNIYTYSKKQRLETDKPD